MESDKKESSDRRSGKRSVHERLHGARTISNFKKCQYIENERKRDRLDYILSSTYNHCAELFPDPEDVFLQNETRRVGVWGPFGFIFEEAKPECDPLGHPIKYGGVPERRSPHDVELIDSSHHSLKTLPGYSRSFGGTVYNY